LQGGRNDHGPNDVASNEKLETEQNRAPHILPVKRIIIASLVCATRCKSYGGNHHAACNNEYTHAIHASADHLHDVPKMFHGTVHSRKARRLSTLFASNALRTTPSTFACLSCEKYFLNHSRKPQCSDRDVRN
jgi:hypothetical protein